MLNLPNDLTVIEINANNTLTLWSRDLNDLAKLIRLIPFPMIQFLKTEERLYRDQTYYWAYVQFLTEFLSEIEEDTFFRPAVSSVTIGEALEKMLAKSARYSHNCIPYSKWCSFESKYKLFS